MAPASSRRQADVREVAFEPRQPGFRLRQSRPWKTKTSSLVVTAWLRLLRINCLFTTRVRSGRKVASTTHDRTIIRLNGLPLAVREKHGNGGSGSAKTGPSIDPGSPAVISRQRCPPEKRLGARSISLVQGNVEAVCRIYISFATNLTCSVVRLVLDHKLADVVALSSKKELPRRVQQWLVEEHQIEQAVAETFPFEEIKICKFG